MLWLSFLSLGKQAATSKSIPYYRIKQLARRVQFDQINKSPARKKLKSP